MEIYQKQEASSLLHWSSAAQKHPIKIYWAGCKEDTPNKIYIYKKIKESKD